MKKFISEINKKQIKVSATFTLLICLFIFFSTLITAQGDLLVFPKRVVFENGKRSEIINLANIGEDTVRYSISFVQIRMNENGSFENISTPDSNQYFADPYVRFYPRTVTLAPKESQVVKLQLTGTSSLVSGEYRSHLYFRAEPVNNTAIINPDVNDKTSLAIRLIPVYGMTIPMIIRVGELTSNVVLSKLTFQRDKEEHPNIQMEFLRSGNTSVYGNIVVNYVSVDGKTTKVGEVTGFAVYTPGNVRKCIIQLKEPNEVDYSSGEITVVYSSPHASKSIRLAGAVLAFDK
jgi:P pilus assembly chaperone PapD